MQLRNTAERYGSISKGLHWILAVGVILMLIVGSIMGSLPDSISGPVYNIHKLIGIFILGVMVLFALWGLINPKPLYGPSMAQWNRILARFVQFLLYLSILAMPLSGWILVTAAGHAPQFFGHSVTMPGIHVSKPLADNADNIHVTLAWIVAGLVALHLLGSLKHYFIDKDDTVQRMMGH